MRKVAPLLALLLAVPLLGGSASAAPCDPTGTWYGGSDWKYMAIVTPNADGSYTLAFQAAYDLKAFSYTAWTSFSGHMVRRGRASFEAQGIGMFVLPPSSDPNTPPSVEMDVFHSTLRLTDGCDTIHHTIDVFGGFVPWTEDKVPFVTPLDASFLPASGVLLETYHRVKQLK